ncbi:MAG: GNAT family N-acetyltransferase [Chloroflexota bacterium]
MDHNMMDHNMIALRAIEPSECEYLHQIAEAYWLELMPHSDVIQDANQRAQYFQDRFPLNTPDHLVQWAINNETIVGIVAARVEPANRRASIEDFYVLPTERSKGYGREMIRKLYQQFDTMDIERVDLNVRRDNPAALAFWEAQGFRIALYHLRQYRDPQSGESFVGALSSDF